MKLLRIAALTLCLMSSGLPAGGDIEKVTETERLAGATLLALSATETAYASSYVFSGLGLSNQSQHEKKIKLGDVSIGTGLYLFTAASNRLAINKIQYPRTLITPYSDLKLGATMITGAGLIAIGTWLNTQYDE